MKKIVIMIKAFLKDNLRSFETTFWSIIFPLILYFILVSVFGNIATSSSIELKLGVIQQEELKAFGKILEEILKEISSEGGPFVLKYYESIESAQKDLATGKQDVILLIPKGTSAGLSGTLLFKKYKINNVLLKIYYVDERQTSNIAAKILEQIFDEVNIEIKKRSDKDFKDLEIVSIPIARHKKATFNYKEYIFPGIVLMAILSVSLFTQNIGLAYNREKGINKRLYTAPVKPIQYFLAFITTMLIMISISIALLYVLAINVYKVETVKVLDPKFMLFTLFSAITLLSFGMMLISIFKKTSTVVVIGQIMNQIMMFLGGLYFPIFDVPWAIRWIVYLLPTTYLGELLRGCMGYRVSTIPFEYLILVPSIWLIISIAIFSFNFKKVMGYE